MIEFHAITSDEYNNADDSLKTPNKIYFLTDTEEICRGTEKYSGVLSFNGRKGNIVPQAGDYTAADVGAALSNHTHQSPIEFRIKRTICKNAETHRKNKVFNILFDEPIELVEGSIFYLEYNQYKYDSDELVQNLSPYKLAVAETILDVDGNENVEVILANLTSRNIKLTTTGIYDNYVAYRSVFSVYEIEIVYNDKLLSLENQYEGYSNLMLGNYSHIEGTNNKTSGDASHAEGNNTKALGKYAHAEGNGTEASGDASHAEGANTRAITTYAHAEGIGTEASGNGAHAEGQSSKTSAIASHAEGNGTQATNYASHAEGTNTKASGHASHAEGTNTEASGSSSHAEGSHTIASSAYSHASGRGNKDMENSTSSSDLVGDAFVIGNGINVAMTNIQRSNAFRINYAGEVYGLSSYNSTGADYAEYFEWLDQNVNNEDRVGKFVTLDGEKIKIANSSDDFILGVVSGKPCIIGNSDEDYMHRWKHDEFGRFMKEYINENSWKYIQNEEYDDNQKYIPRKNRKEWSAIGMLGVLSVIDNGTCQINSYCKITDNGTATLAESYIPNKTFRVISRVSNNVIKILFR